LIGDVKWPMLPTSQETEICMANKKIHLGIAGLGRGFSVMLPTLAMYPGLAVLAAADTREEARRRFESDFGGTAYETIKQLCDDDRLDAIYVATPHQFHEEHVIAAAAAGKHVLVEKPMALTVESCTRMIEAAEKAGVHIVVGHSHSFDAPILTARRLIAAGRFGPVKMITAINYTDFIYRPRRPEELDSAQGGGVVFSQGAHQVDIVRLLAGGMARSVTAVTGDWDVSRPTEGAYTALIKFADGAFANLTYNGYGRFDTDEFTGWIGEMGREKSPDIYGASRDALTGIRDPHAEAAFKASRAYGGPDGAALPPSDFMRGKTHEHFGVFVASCAGGDIRPLPSRLELYGEKRETIPLVPPAVPREEVIDELYAAVIDGAAPLHSGEWGRATLEVCLAILESARLGKEIDLAFQVPVRDAPDGERL